MGHQLISNNGLLKSKSQKGILSDSGNVGLGGGPQTQGSHQSVNCSIKHLWMNPFNNKPTKFPMFDKHCL